MNRMLAMAMVITNLIVVGTAVRVVSANRSATPYQATAMTVTPSTFTYQGRLQHNGQPYTGACDLSFDLYDAPSGGDEIGSQSLKAVSVTGGLFIAALDFGADAFNAGPRWLETTVQCDSGEGTWTLAPRQPITVAPVALSARNLTTDASPQLESNTADSLLSVINHGSGPGVRAKADDGPGVTGLGSPGVSGISSSGPGLAGTSTHGSGVYGYGYDSDAVGVTGEGNNGAPGMRAIGNAIQDGRGAGWAKALLYVDASSDIFQCYNGITGATYSQGSSNFTRSACGFTANYVLTNGSTDGHYTIDFGFDVRSRFFSVTEIDSFNPLYDALVVSPDPNNANQLDVYFRYIFDNTVNSASFYLMVF